MAHILGRTPDEISILLEIVLPVGTAFEVVENFKGKCFEHRQAMVPKEEPRTKFERLPEPAKQFFTENLSNMQFKSATEFTSKITQLLVMWAEVREKKGKTLEKIQEYKHKLQVTSQFQENKRYVENLQKLEAWADEKCAAHVEVNKQYAEMKKADEEVMEVDEVDKADEA